MEGEGITETAHTQTQLPHSCIRVVPHTHTVTLRNTYIQGDDSLPQGLTEVVDGVIDGILLNTQMEDPLCIA